MIIDDEANFEDIIYKVNRELDNRLRKMSTPIFYDYTWHHYRNSVLIDEFGYSDGFKKNFKSEYSSAYANRLTVTEAIDNTMNAINEYIESHKDYDIFFFWPPEAEEWHDCVYIRMGLYAVKRELSPSP